MFCLWGVKMPLRLTLLDLLPPRIHPEWFVHVCVAFLHGQKQAFRAGGPRKIILPLLRAPRYALSFQA